MNEGMVTFKVGQKQYIPVDFKPTVTKIASWYYGGKSYRVTKRYLSFQPNADGGLMERDSPDEEWTPCEVLAT